MKMHRFAVALPALAFAATTAMACTLSTPEGVTGATSAALDLNDGHKTPGREMNGREMNGREMNGTSLRTGPGVWYALYAGATYDVVETMPIASELAGPAGPLALAPAAAQAPLMEGFGLGGDSAISHTVALSAIQRPSAPSGELVATFVDGGITTTLRGAAFKGITLMGKGPAPYAPPVAVVDADAGLDGAALPPAAEGAPPASPRDVVRAYVTRLRALTDLPVRDVPLRIVDAVPVPPADAFHASPRATLWHYKVLVKNGATWEDFCSDGRYVVALPDTWSYVQGFAGDATGRPAGGSLVPSTTGFTLACDGSVLTKCIERLGYTPWGTKHVSTNNDVPIAPLLESCVRMVRADYCGNGISMTKNGTLIDVSDALLVNRPSFPASDWTPEARWNRAGATCGEATRQITIPQEGNDGVVSVQEYVDMFCPGAFTATSPSWSCGPPSPFQGAATGTLRPAGAPAAAGGKQTLDSSLIYTSVRVRAGSASPRPGLELAPLPVLATP